MKFARRRGTSIRWAAPGVFLLVMAMASFTFGVTDIVNYPILCPNPSGSGVILCALNGSSSTTTTTSTSASSTVGCPAGYTFNGYVCVENTGSSTTATATTTPATSTSTSSTPYCTGNTYLVNGQCEPVQQQTSTSTYVTSTCGPGYCGTTTATATANLNPCNASPGGTCTLLVTSVTVTRYGNLPNVGDTITLTGQLCSGDGCTAISQSAVTNGFGVASFTLPSETQGRVGPITSYQGVLTVKDTTLQNTGTVNWPSQTTAVLYYVVRFSSIGALSGYPISGVDELILGFALLTLGAAFISVARRK